MYTYIVEPMPGNRKSHVGDTSGKYRIRQYYTPASVMDERHSSIYQDNLDYQEAVDLTQQLNEEEARNRPES